MKKKRNYTITSVLKNGEIQHFYFEKNVTQYQTDVFPHEALAHRIRAEHEDIMKNQRVLRLETKVWS